MGNGNHNRNCATAQRHECRCTGCGGSLHSWVGLVDLAGGDHTERQRRRERHESRLRTKRGSRRLGNNRQNREASTDLARLDIADWLATSSPRRTSDGVAAHPSPINQVTTIAEEMTRGTWSDIAAELGSVRPEATPIKRQLAYHGWCDLFVGMIQAIQTTQGALGSMQETAKKLVTRAILNSSMQGNRAHVTEAVVDVVVDRTWQAFKLTAFAGAPLLQIITSTEALCALRILAVFICPAPDDHEEVRRHALKPLGSDTAKILTEQTKVRLADLFAEWRPGGGNDQAAE
jgi:hypothetical protein